MQRGTERKRISASGRKKKVTDSCGEEGGGQKKKDEYHAHTKKSIRIEPQI